MSIGIPQRISGALITDSPIRIHSRIPSMPPRPGYDDASNDDVVDLVTLCT